MAIKHIISEEYYTPGYFSGQNPDSPYPKDQRYLNPNHPLIHRKFIDLYDFVDALKPARHDGILRLLDVGCGPAHTEVVFKQKGPKIKVWNVDGFYSVAKFAKDRGASRVAQVQQQALSFPNDFFSLVTLWDVIEHVPQKESAQAISEAYRVLDHGGVLAVRTPNRITWTDKYRQDDSHVWFPNPGDINKMFDESGFGKTRRITTRGFPGTSLLQKIFPGDFYFPVGGGVILAVAKKE